MREGYLPSGHRELETLSIRSYRRSGSSYTCASEASESPIGSPSDLPGNDRCINEHDTLQHNLRDAVPRFYNEILIPMIEEDDLDFTILVRVDDSTAYSDPVLHS